MRERWARVVGAPAEGTIVAPHCAAFEEDGAPTVTFDVPAGSIVANSRFAIALDERLGDGDVWTCDGRVVAVRASRAVPSGTIAAGDVSLDDLAEGRTKKAVVRGRWLHNVWDLVTSLIDQLREDIGHLASTMTRASIPHATIIGDRSRVLVDASAIIEPHVVFDVTSGPILIGAGTSVRAFTRIVGPCAIGRSSNILGDRVHGCSIGDHCNIRGEISETVVLGHANKVHDGFVGHSYLGRWVNLGAGTITSNLKNTYGPVMFWTPAGLRDSGTLKLGTFFGDHAKVGIGMRLTTGTVVGAGANIYGSAMPPKYVPPFSWGEGDSLGTYRLDKFLEVTSRAMARRQVTLGDRGREQLSQAFARAQQESG
jgi:UDP-N-acetylglucosamine diphosphorylase/glucosamine-1-phosphate N-acetyltransferase